MEELTGPDARAFGFMDAKRRPTLLGSFKVSEGGAPFYVSVIVKEKKTDDFQFFVMENLRRSAALATDTVDNGALVWRYSAAKQHGDNAARNAEFQRLAGSDTVRIPLPSKADEFAAAVRRALSLRHKADLAGGEDASDEDEEPAIDELRRWYPDPTVLKGVASAMVAAIRDAHAQNPRAWCVTRRRTKDLFRVNVGIARVFDIWPDSIQLAVTVDDMPKAERDSLGKKLDLGPNNQLNRETFGENGAVVVGAGEVSGLPEDVLRAHREFIARAAPATSPFGRFHNPEVLDALRELSGEEVPDPEPAGALKSAFWKVAPGEHGGEWPRCRDGGFIAIGWGELGDLTGIDKAEFNGRVREALEDWGPEVEQAWKFKGIQVGDRIVANDGTSRVLGIGTVTGPYYFVADDEYAHRLPVQWDEVGERRVEMPGWRRTLIRLTEDVFNRVVAAPPDGQIESKPAVEVARPSGGIDFDGILSELKNKGLAFPTELVASYLLALQAKRFVLLTGISGTGKTQLALEIAKIFSEQVEERAVASAGDGEVDGQVGNAHLKYRRIFLPREALRLFPDLEDVSRNSLRVDIGGRTVEARLYRDSSRPLAVFLALDTETLWPWFSKTFVLGDPIRFSKGKDDDLLVIRKPGVVATSVTVKNYELVSVRPDWTDARALLGFYNPLLHEYAHTSTLQLLVRASDEVDRARAEGRAPRPFFVIFDEMNLARVEHYFSDFLSAMESGEPIQLHDDDDVAEADEGVPKSITLPPNLFVVGTVNVDETTYMFSPKVLDRAFVLEFNDVALEALDAGGNLEASSGTPLALSEMAEGFKLLGRPTLDEWSSFCKLDEGQSRTVLGEIHAVLEQENRHFGYRVAREIARFVSLASEQTGGAEGAIAAALDVAVLAKVLPKLHGTQAELDRILEALFAAAVGLGKDHDAVRDLDAWTIRLGRIESSSLPRLPRTATKLLRMRRRLRAQGFVSFIE